MDETRSAGMASGESAAGPTPGAAGLGTGTTQATSESRRRFTKAGLAAPVVMTLASRPVWGTQCSLSGDIMSGNASQHDHECTLGVGCTPGFWKNNLPPWVLTGYSPGTCLADKDGKCNANAIDARIEAGATSFVSVFGKEPLEGSGLSLMEVLQRPGGNFNLEQHAVAAVLNTLAYDGYGASHADIVNAYQRAVNSGELEPLATVLDAMNNRGCPIDAHGVCKDDISVDLDGDGVYELCNVPTAADGDRCVAVITQDVLDNQTYKCPEPPSEP